jgi:hypothetical protein
MESRTEKNAKHEQEER